MYKYFVDGIRSGRQPTSPMSLWVLWTSYPFLFRPFWFSSSHGRIPIQIPVLGPSLRRFEDLSWVLPKFPISVSSSPNGPSLCLVVEFLLFVWSVPCLYTSSLTEVSSNLSDPLFSLLYLVTFPVLSFPTFRIWLHNPCLGDLLPLCSVLKFANVQVWTDTFPERRRHVLYLLFRSTGNVFWFLLRRR